MSDRGPDFQPPATPPGPPAPFDPRQPIVPTGPDRRVPAGSAPGAPRPPRPARPPRRWGPTVITGAVLAVAALLIVTGVLVGRYRDQHATAATTPTPSAPAPVTPPPTDANGDATATAFEAETGSGTLSIVGHAWTTGGSPPPQFGAYLLIEIQVKVDTGDLELGPPFFSAFDADSQSYTATTTELRRPALEDAVVHAGQTARGWIAFDIDRGRTLVMLAGQDARPIAALKVEG